MSAITSETRPTLAAKARLRWDRQTSRYLLLYPERGLVLNPTAADVVQLCTGEHTVGAIVDRQFPVVEGYVRRRSRGQDGEP